MKVFGTLMCAAAVLGLFAVATDPAAAAPKSLLNWGKNLSATETACPNGRLLVSVNQKIANSIDSAVGGGYWAYIDYQRHITVVALGGENYCATVKYQGQFASTGLKSPAGTVGALASGVKGTFQGGYTATFTATDFSPTLRTQGFIGSYDQNCDASTGDCPGYVNWLDQYFTGVADFDYTWWGWIYHGGRHGTWVNAVDGNSGDITG